MPETGPSQGPGAEAVPTTEDAAVEISFLSTARAGTVIVRNTQLRRALRALELGTDHQTATA